MTCTTRSGPADRAHAPHRRNGVQEYVVWQIEEGRVDWFVLEEGKYLSLSPNEASCLASRAFPGLVLDVEALPAEDVSAVLAHVQEQTGPDENQAFVERLSKRAE